MKTHMIPPSVPSHSTFGRNFLLTSALIASLLGGVSAQATTYDWTNTDESDYGTAANWTPSGGPPGSADTAVLGYATLPNGTIDFTSADTYTLNTLTMGSVAGTTAFNMSGGSFTINKSGTDGFDLGKASGATATFTMDGGTFSVIRPTTYYQDCVSPGNTAGSSGSIIINNGTAIFQCGVEIGYNGVGTVTINGGNVYGSGWWNAGRGSNSGNTSQNQGSGTFNLTGGTLWLQQTNSGLTGKGLYIQQTATNGTVNISGGVLICEGIRVMNANSLAAGATAPTATLNVSGGDLYLGATGMTKPGSLASGIATVNLSGGTFHTTNSLSPGNDESWVWNANLPANITSGSVTFAPGAGQTITLSNVFSGAGGLTVAGPGTVDIEGGSAYTGDTTLSGGTVSGSGSVQGNVTATSAATIAPGSVTVPATLSLGNSLILNGNTNVIKLSSNPFSVGNGVNDLISTLGNLTLENVSTIEVVPLGPLSPDYPYTVLQYGGTNLLSGDAAHLRVISGSPRYSFSVVDPSTTYPYIQFNVVGNAANLVWRGGVVSNPTAWDHATANWFNTGTSASNLFYNGDAVVFDDTALTNLVTVADSDQASAITMSNNAVSFTFAGNSLLTGPLDMEGTNSLTLALEITPDLTGITNDSGTLVFNLANSQDNTVSAPISDNGLGAGTIIQGGTNTLVLSGANSSYYGTLMVTNGVLQYTATAALGAGSTLYVTNNGTLDFNHVSAGTKSIVISGDGFNGQGAVNDSNPSASAAHVVLNYLTLSNNASIGSQGRWDMSSAGSVIGNDFNLTKVGSGVTILDGVSDSGLGNVEVTTGRLSFQHGCTPGDSTKTLTVDSGAQLTLYALTAPANKQMLLQNGCLVDSGGSANTFAGPVTLAGTNNFATRADLHLAGAVGGTGGLTEATNSSIGGGNGILYFEGANTYSGPTFLGQGSTISVSASSSLGSSSLIVLSNASTLDVSALEPLTLGTGQTLVGIGTVLGDITFDSGSALSVGLSASSTAALTVNGNLAFQSGSTNIFKVNPGTVTSDLVTGLSSVTYGGTLVVTKIGASAFAANTTFQLFSATTYNPSSFAAVVLPNPGAGLTWDISGLAANGTLKIVAQPQFTSISKLGDGNFQFTFTGNVGSSYSLLASTNVALPLASWTVLSSGTITSSPLTIQDLTATNHPQRFYTISMP